MKLWLDDVRLPPVQWKPEETCTVTTAEAAIELLDHQWDGITFVSLDHDLGTEKDGMDVLNWIEEQLKTGVRECLPFGIACHSMNPVENKRMSNVATMLWLQHHCSLVDPV